MNSKEMDQFIIDSYQRDEQTMILIFAQWCINHQLDPIEVYGRAYPGQGSNEALQQAITLTVTKEEAGEIDDDTVLQVLSLFGNEELAFIVSEEISSRLNRSK
ncbi:MAG: hypothetical protein ACE3L7_07020 [Candidatus Pristimantibacillus sp.]